MTKINKLRKRKILYKKEPGSIFMEEISVIFVMVFMFIMMLIYSSYIRAIEMKTVLNTVGREYLYQMEQYGYLSNQMQIMMREDLIALGVIPDSIDFQETSHKEPAKAEYGEKVTLVCQVTFENPIYTVINVPQLNLPFLTESNRNVDYEIRMSATTKW